MKHYMNNISGGDRIQAALFKILKNNAVKGLQQCVSNFGKLSSGHRPGKGQFPSQSPRRKMTKNVATTTPSGSFLMWARYCSQSYKLRFSSTWSDSFQPHKHDSEKADEPDQFTGSWRIQGNSRKKKKKTFFFSFCFIDYGKAFDCVDHNKVWKILKDMGIPDCLTWLQRNLYVGQSATVRTGHGTTDWFPLGKEYKISSCGFYNLYAEHIMPNVIPAWMTSWNQDCWQKYQQHQICRWYHFNGR